MTDTLTASMVENTITTLTSTLERATARLATEADEYTAKRDAMVAVAHERGTTHSIGSALDDLLEEFDLPRRPARGDLRMLLRLTAPLQDRAVIAGGYYVHPSAHVQVSWVQAMDFTTSMTEGHDCLCGDVTKVRQWLRSNYGADRVASMTFQMLDPSCTVVVDGDRACPNYGDTPYPDTSRTDLDWTNQPSYPAQAPA